MNGSGPAAASDVSESERELLRQSVRGLLAEHWPVDKAVEKAGDAAAIASLWRAMAAQGLAALGTDDGGVGLREIVLVFEELGRASCPAPLLGAVAANLTLSHDRTNAVRALLADMHNGDAVVAIALGAFDGDAAAGQVELGRDTISGRMAFVEGVQAATHVLLCTQAPAGLAIVATGAPGLTIREMQGLPVPSFTELNLDNVPAITIGRSSEAIIDLATVARLVCAARAVGAAQRAFDLAVDHAKVRKQFGQIIGSFQAVQHKLANCLISLDGARMTIDAAATARDRGAPDWQVFAASALAFAGPALRAVSIETHRALGAIGYAEEHEAPRHFRRVHADLARFGGAPHARAQLADFLLGPVQ